VTIKAVTPAGEGLFDAMRGARPRLFGERQLWAAAFMAPLTHDLPLSDRTEVGGLGRCWRARPRSSREEQQRGAVLCQLIVTAEAPLTVALLLRSAVLAQQTVEVGQDEVTFPLAPGDLLPKLATVRLRLLDERGAPVVGAHVAILGASEGGAMAVTDSLGRGAAEVLPGRWRLHCGDSSVSIPALEVEAAAGGMLDLGDLVLRSIAAVPIAPLDFIGSCTAVVQGLDVPPWACSSGETHQFVEEQGFTMYLYPGRHAIIAKATSQWAIGVIDTNALPPLPLHLEFHDVVPLRVESERADGYWQVGIRTAMGVPVHSFEFGGAHTFFLRLPAGSYEAAWTDLDRRRTVRAFTLGPDGGVLVLE